MQIDNSPGGEVWVPEGKQWGPLAGRMLHLSYGKCALFNVLSETVDGVRAGRVGEVSAQVHQRHHARPLQSERTGSST